MLEGLIGINSPTRIELQTPCQKIQGNELVIGEGPLLLIANSTPHDDFSEIKATRANGGDIDIKYAAVELTCLAHALVAKDGGYLNHGVDVIGRIEEWKASGQDGQQDHAGGPDVNLCGLFCAFEQHLGGTETTCAGAVGSTRRPGIVFWVAVVWAAVGGDSVPQALATNSVVLMAEARLCLLTLTLCQTKIYQHPTLRRGVVEKICGLDVSMYNVVGMNCRKGSEEGPEIDGHVGDCHIAEVVAEVVVGKVGQDGDNLVGGAEGGNQGANGRAVAEVVEELELVEDASGR